jgi:hypothetical protein
LQKKGDGDKASSSFVASQDLTLAHLTPAHCSLLQLPFSYPLPLILIKIITCQCPIKNVFDMGHFNKILFKNFFSRLIKIIASMMTMIYVFTPDPIKFVQIFLHPLKLHSKKMVSLSAPSIGSSVFKPLQMEKKNEKIGSYSCLSRGSHDADSGNSIFTGSIQPSQECARNR